MDSYKKSIVITFRVNENERERLVEKANAESKTLSGYIRDKVIRESKGNE